MPRLFPLEDEHRQRIFGRINLIVEEIHKHAVEPAFSEDIERRGGSQRISSYADDFILKRMILLIAFSQQAQSRQIVDLNERGVFERVFASCIPAEVARLNPEELKRKYWNREFLTPMRFKGKVDRMINCAKVLMQISSEHGSFVRYLESQQFPAAIATESDLKLFWDAFDNTLQDFKRLELPFFQNVTSLCHLLQDLGFDCAKPDSVVMEVGDRLGILATRRDQTRLSQNRKYKRVIQTMQLYAAINEIRTPVVDLYFLIYGGQTDARKFVNPSFYELSK